MKKLITSITAGSIFFLNSSIAFAQEIPTITIPRPPQIKWLDLGKIIASVIGLLLMIATLASFIYFIWGGIQWILSGGDKTGVEAAKNRIQAALVGLVVVFSAWALFTLVGRFLGIDPFNLVFSPAF